MGKIADMCASHIWLVNGAIICGLTLSFFTLTRSKSKWGEISSGMFFFFTLALAGMIGILLQNQSSVQAAAKAKVEIAQSQAVATLTIYLKGEPVARDDAWWLEAPPYISMASYREIILEAAKQAGLNPPANPTKQDDFLQEIIVKKLRHDFVVQLKPAPEGEPQ